MAAAGGQVVGGRLCLLNMQEALRLGLLEFFAIFGLRVLLKKDWLAAIAASVLFTTIARTISSTIRSGRNMLVIYVVLYAILMFVLVRVGLVTAISAMFFLNALNRICLGSDWKAWWAPYGFATIFLLFSMVSLALWRSIGTESSAHAEAVRAQTAIVFRNVEHELYDFRNLAVFGNSIRMRAPSCGGSINEKTVHSLWSLWRWARRSPPRSKPARPHGFGNWNIYIHRDEIPFRHVAAIHRVDTNDGTTQSLQQARQVGNLLQNLNGGGAYSSANVLYFDGAGHISVAASATSFTASTVVGTLYSE